MEIVAEIIREHYDLGEMKTPYQLENTHQRRHRKMVVESEVGKFLAKTYKDDPVTIDALYFQHNLANHLRNSQLPVARIQTTRNGRTFVCLEGWTLELQEFLEGLSMRVTENTLRVSGSALGRYHQVCQGLPAPPRDARKWRFSEVPREIFQNFYQMAIQEGDTDRTRQHCDNIGKFLQQAAIVLDIDKRYAFETGVIHGDWHGGNLLFQGEELNGVIDLEFAGDGCYLEDIAYAVSNLCIRTSMTPEKLVYRTELMLGAYEKHRTLSYSERVALYYAVGVKHVTTVSYQAPQQEGKVAGYTPTQWLRLLDLQTQWLASQSHKARWGI